MESMSSDTRRAKASLSFSRCFGRRLLHMLFESGGAAAEREHLLGQAIRSRAGGIDGSRRGRLDVAQLLLDLLANDAFERVRESHPKASRRFRESTFAIASRARSAA